MILTLIIAGIIALTWPTVKSLREAYVDRAVQRGTWPKRIDDDAIRTSAFSLANLAIRREWIRLAIHLTACATVLSLLLYKIDWIELSVMRPTRTWGAVLISILCSFNSWRDNRGKRIVTERLRRARS